MYNKKPPKHSVKFCVIFTWFSVFLGVLGFIICKDQYAGK